MKLFVRTQHEMDQLAKNNPKAHLKAMLSGWYIGRVPNEFLVGEYRDISSNTVACVKENLLYFRRLDKQCSDDPSSVERLKREANFDFNTKCPKLNAGEKKSQAVISRILAESFLFLIGSSDEISNSKFCPCRDFNKFIKFKNSEIKKRRSKLAKSKVPDPKLEDDAKIVAAFTTEVAGYFADANANCKTDKTQLTATTKREKKDRTQKLNKAKDEFKKGMKVRIDTFNKKIQAGLQAAYADAPAFHIPTEKEWKQTRKAEAEKKRVAKAVISEATKIAKKAAQEAKRIAAEAGRVIKRVVQIVKKP
jgi:hypothetical protein